MTLIQFFRLFNRNLGLLILCALLMAILVFVLTRNLPREYATETEVYTGIASGLNVVNLGSTKVDYFATNTEYDNLINIIKSRQTLEEVGYRLMVQHMMLDSLDRDILGEEAYAVFRYYMPEAREKELLVPYSVELTLNNLRNYRRENYSKDLVKWAFESDGSPYSYKAIGNIKVSRVQSSDLLRISYVWTDPGIAQNTLLILNEVFTENVSKIKQGQSDDVVSYFREQVNLAARDLDLAEQRLQDFRVENKMINYQEQTRILAIKKESMEDEYQKEFAVKKAAEAAVDRLTRQLSMNNVMIQLGNAILEKKKELIEIRAKIAELETYYNDVDLLNKLRVKADKLQEEVSNQILQRYERSRTTDGVPVESLIQQWLANTLALDESVARLEVYKDRKEYFQEKYDEFARLGAQAARLERQIDIEENNYLDLLYSLNQAKLRQRSQKISTGGIVVTLPPPLPLEPLPSKSFLLVMVAFLVGFIAPFFFILLREFMDASVRTPERAEQLTGLKLLGAYPDLTKRNESRTVDFDWLHQKAAALMVQNIRLEAKHHGVAEERPKFCLVFSTREKDGKLTTVHVLANELVSLNFRVMVLGPKAFPKEESPFYDYIRYENDKRFVNAESLSDIVPMGYDPALYDYFFLILDAVLINPYPLNLLEQFHLSICTLGAFRSWNRADVAALADFQETFVEPKPRLVLNAVEPDFMQNVLGDIEKRRSWLRRFIKRILTLQLRKPRLRKEKTRAT